MSIKIHHLNCGTMCPKCQRLVNGYGSWIKPAEMVCHCLLIETPETLVLVDTGLGTQDVRNPSGLTRGFKRNNRPRLQLEETAHAQIKALGYDTRDVGHIIATHLDVDHAGGLPDFPEAAVHLFKPELESALTPVTKLAQGRYRPHHVSHQPKWVLHEVAGDQWFGFEAIRMLPIAGADILLVPLVGHTPGHTGVAVRDGDRWLLHCGDAFFHQGTLSDPPRVPLALRVFDHLLQTDGAQRIHNQARLRALAANHGHEIDIFCSHDPMAWRQLRERSRVDVSEGPAHQAVFVG